MTVIVSIKVQNAVEKFFNFLSSYADPDNGLLKAEMCHVAVLCNTKIQVAFDGYSS